MTQGLGSGSMPVASPVKRRFNEILQGAPFSGPQYDIYRIRTRVRENGELSVPSPPRRKV